MPPTKDNNTYCYYTKHEYYNRQGDICKSCDKCVLGWGLASIEQREFDIDPVHGALGCRHCIPCPKGFYSGQYTYEECRPCTDCLKEGRSENVQCNSKQNAICGNFLQNRSSSNGLSAENIYLIVSLCFASFIAVIIVIFVYLCLKKKRINGQNERKCPTEGDESTKELIQTTALSSSTSTMSNSRDLESDAVPDMVTKPSFDDMITQWKQSHASAINAVLSDRHARMISTSIAGALAVKDVGLTLRLSDSSIKIIQENFHKDVLEQAYETLIKWKQINASDATVSRFLDALRSLRLHSIAKEFCDKYDEHVRSCEV